MQQHTLDYITRLKAHPHCPRLLVTAHQGEGKNSEGIQTRCLGPIVKGKGLVDKAPGWFSSYFHMEVMPAYIAPNGQQMPEHRAMWFRFHPDRNGSGLMWPGKLGASPRVTHEFQQRHPYGFIPSWNIEGNIVGGIKDFLSKTGLSAPGG